jgi:hypothetical protein
MSLATAAENRQSNSGDTCCSIIETVCFACTRRSTSVHFSTTLLTYLLTQWPKSASELYRTSDRRLSAKLAPTSADRGCHVVGVTDPYCRILGFLDRTCFVNPIDNTHYAPITTTPSTRTKYFTRTLAQSTSLQHLHKVYH